MKKEFYYKRRRDKYSRKLQARKYHTVNRKKYPHRPSVKNNESNNKNYIREVYEFRKDVPEEFSFLNNTKQTLEFFEDILKEIQAKKFKNMFFINSYNVGSVTVDALMYLIAIMRNIRLNKYMQYTFKGNLPDNAVAKSVYKESGFLTFVNSKQKQLPSNSNKIKIVSGTQNDPQLAKSVCEFVMDKLEKSRTEILPVQKILIELMSNVFHHAYNFDDMMNKNWYIYVEYFNNAVRFVFVDTGAGIARTVKKNFWEKINRKLGTNASDGDLIYSTLNGDFRTETNQNYRGNGLSGVYEIVKQDLFMHFMVISGSGACETCGSEKKLNKYDYNSGIYGTIYIFDIR